MEHYLNNRGYVLYKSLLSSNDLAQIKEELTVKPIDIPGYGPESEGFRTFLESNNKLYIPKHYGLERFGVPKTMKIPEGEDIKLCFKGSLRQKQLDAVDLVLDACRDPSKMGAILCLNCGEGKTVCAIYMVGVLKKKAMIVVHKDFLLQQWKERIEEFMPGARIGTIKAQVLDVKNKDIVLASLQTLSMKDLDNEVFDGIGTVVFDEVHRTSARVFSQAFRKLNFRNSIGLTATPNRKDGLTKVFMWNIGDIAFKSEKRKDNLLVRFLEYYKSDPEYGQEIFMYNKKPNVIRMINNICEYLPRIEFVVDTIKKIFQEEPGRKIIVMSDRRLHLELIKNLLDKALVSCGLYYGGLNERQLKESEGKNVMLCSFSFAAEGMDVKGLDTMILASPKTDVVQASGRILRTPAHERKYTPMIVDIVDNFSVFTNQAKKRYKYYKSCNYDIEDNDKIFASRKLEIPKGQYLFREDV